MNFLYSLYFFQTAFNHILEVFSVTDEQTLLPDERRCYERLGKKSTIRYRHLEDLTSEGQERHGILCDFSGGGLRFIAEEILSKNMQLSLELKFPGWLAQGEEWVQTGNKSDIGTLKAIGRVMWCSECEDCKGKFETGVRFTGRIR